MAKVSGRLVIVCGLLLRGWGAFAPADAMAAPNTTLSSYSVFAIDGLRSKGLDVASGNVGVNDGTLFVHGALSAPTSEVVANVVRIDPRSGCQTLYANDLQRTGPGCAPAAPFASPLFPDVAAACGFPAPFPSCGGNDVMVAPGAALSLAPGVYGTVTVGPGAQLALTGGHYVFCSVRAARGANIGAEAPSEIDIAGTLRLGNEVAFGPAATSGLTPFDVTVYVAGPSLHYSRMSSVDAAVCAPNALARLTQGGHHAGQLIALGIRTEHVSFGPATPPQECGGPGPMCGGDCPQGQSCIYFFGEGCSCI